MQVIVRPALADDQAAITALTRGERVKPMGLYWPRFVLRSVRESWLAPFN